MNACAKSCVVDLDLLNLANSSSSKGFRLSVDSYNFRISLDGEVITLNACNKCEKYCFRISIDGEEIILNVSNN